MLLSFDLSVILASGFAGVIGVSILLKIIRERRVRKEIAESYNRLQSYWERAARLRFRVELIFLLNSIKEIYDQLYPGYGNEPVFNEELIFSFDQNKISDLEKEKIRGFLMREIASHHSHGWIRNAEIAITDMIIRITPVDTLVREYLEIRADHEKEFAHVSVISTGENHSSYSREKILEMLAVVRKGNDFEMNFRYGMSEIIEEILPAKDLYADPYKDQDC